jgi:hypothetical protein
MPVNTQIFDDGSTLSYSEDYGFVSATPGDAVVNRASASWLPGAVNPNAGSWDDVLKFGFSRLIDAKVRPVQSDNAAAVPERVQSLGSALPTASKGGVPMAWVVVGALALGVLFLRKAA